jgi:hypothetical protein
VPARARQTSLLHFTFALAQGATSFLHLVLALAQAFHVERLLFENNKFCGLKTTKIISKSLAITHPFMVKLVTRGCG